MSIDYFRHRRPGPHRLPYRDSLISSVNGVAHFANMSDPQIPAALAPAVVGIVSLHDFKPQAQHRAETTPQCQLVRQGSSIFYLCAARSRDDLQLQSAVQRRLQRPGPNHRIWSNRQQSVRQQRLDHVPLTTFGLSSYTAGLVDHDPSGAAAREAPIAPIPERPDDGDDGEAITRRRICQCRRTERRNRAGVLRRYRIPSA